MAIFGSTGQPSPGAEWFGLNSINHFAELHTMPEDGTITNVGFWAAGKDAAVNARACVWTAGGTLIASSGVITLTGRGLWGSDLYAPVVGPVFVAGGTQIYLGFARDPSGAIQLPFSSGSSHLHKYSGSWPGAISGSSSHGGNIGTYGVYTPYEPPPPTGGTLELYVRRGGVWVRVDPTQFFVRRGGAWSQVDDGEFFVRRGGVWVPV